MEFRDIKDVLTFAAFRPEPDNPSAPWPKRFPNKRTLLLNISRTGVSWRGLDKKGRIAEYGSQDGEFLDVAAQMADEWKALADDGWVGVSVNNRFIISLEQNLSRKSGWQDAIRTNPKSILGAKYDRNKRYALHHNPETSASLLLACDESMVKTIEDNLRNHNLRTGRMAVGLFAMTAGLLEKLHADEATKEQDLIVITWCDGSLCVLRQKQGQWVELRCRSGLPPQDATAVTAILKPFFADVDAETRVVFMGNDPENRFAEEFLPQMESFHVTDVTEPGQLWTVLGQS